MSVTFDRWFWITVLSVFLVVVVPLIIVWFILQPFVPPEGRIVATILIVVIWGVVSGYKDWLKAKRKEVREASSKE
jgi:hypothetical protein